MPGKTPDLSDLLVAGGVSAPVAQALEDTLVNIVPNGQTPKAGQITVAQAENLQSLVSGASIRQLSNRCYMPKNIGGTLRQLMARLTHKALAPMQSVQLVYPSWYMASGYTETAQGAAGTIKASIEYPAGTFTPVTFGGAVVGVQPNNVNLVSDACSVNILEGETFWVRTFVTNPTALVYNGNHVAITGDQFDSSTTTVTDTTMGGTGTGAGVNMYGPCAIIGLSSKRATLIAGDSVGYGIGDVAYAGNIGYIARSIGSRVPHITISSPSDVAGQFPAGSTRRMELAPYCTDVAMQYGTNDLPGTPSATVLAAIAAVVAMFAGKQVYVATLPPRTTSTDSWVTTANQTVTVNEANRVAVNTGIRAGIAGSQGCMDIADALESSRNSGLWAVDVSSTTLARTTDGVHPSASGHALGVSRRVVPVELLS